MRILDPEDWIDSDEDQPRAPAARNNAAGRARAVPPSLSGHAATPSSTEAAFAGQLGPQTPSTDAKPRKRGGRTADRVFSEYYRYCYLSGNSVYNCSFCDHCFGVMRDADGTMKPSTKIVRHFREHHSKMLDEMFPPFIDIEPSTSLLKQGAFGILVQGLGLDDGGHDQTSVILHPVFNMFELRGGLVRNESGHPQLMLAGKLALPRGSKAMAWPVSLFKNFVRVPNEDIRGYAVFAFARSVGSSSSPGLRAQIVGRGKKAMVADGACPMVVNFPIAQEDPEWGPVIILNQKGASSPWYAHCKQRKSDRAIFCLYCSHAYGVKAGAKSQKKNPDDADDMEEDGGDSDGEGSAKDAKLKIPNAKGGMTSNIKRHVIGHHSEELQNNDVTGAPFPPCNPVGSELLGFLLEQQPPPWDYDDPAMGMTAAYAIHPAIAFEEIKAEPAGAQGFTLSGRIVLISKDRSSVDLIINWENVFPRAPDYRTQTSVHVFQRLVPMELKGGQEIQQAHAMRMQSAPFEWIVWIRLL